MPFTYNLSYIRTGLSKQVSFQGDKRPGDWAIENFLLTPSGFMWPKVTTKRPSFTTRLRTSLNARGVRIVIRWPTTRVRP